MVFWLSFSLNGDLPVAWAGIRIWGDHVTLRRNLVMMTLWPGSYRGREEPFNFDWNAAIEVSSPPPGDRPRRLGTHADALPRFYRSARGPTWCCSTTS